MSECVFRRDSIEIDKTPDGRYWFVLSWPNDQVALRLRIEHTSWDDPDRFIAEVYERQPDDNHGRTEDYTVVGHFMLSPFDVEPYLDELPTQWRSEFIAMIKHWGHLLEASAFGGALGTREPSSDVA